MAWDIFVKESRTRTTSPMLTIGKKLGRCSLNRAAAAMFEREAVEFVLLMFDKSARKMGLRPVSKKDPRAFAVRYIRSKDKDKAVVGAAFSGITFLQHHGYDLSETKGYPIQWDTEDSIFDVQLPEEKFNVQQKPLGAVEGGRKHGRSAAAD
jgi:hypothetical protein